MNDGEISIEYVDDDVRVSRITDDGSEGMGMDDEIGGLICKALENRN